MRRDLAARSFNSSFLSCENDVELILNKLFVENKPYCDYLKRLLVINTKNCLDIEDSEIITKVLLETNLRTLIKDGYIRLAPKLTIGEHEEVKTYIIVSMNNYTPNATNPQFRDCTISFDIICNIDNWDLGDYRNRPLKIAGYIDGILNNAKLTGIGRLNFMGCDELILNEELAGYTLSYRAIHGSDDSISFSE